MLLPSFEDIHPDYGKGMPSHLVTNECPETFRLMLGPRTRLGKAASICSGGEIPLLVLLPRCDAVYAIDHFLQPLAVTFLKVAILANMGPLGAKKFFEKDDFPAFRQVLLDHVKYLPDALAKCLKITSQVPPKSPVPKPGTYQPRPDIYCSHDTINETTFKAIRCEWHYASLGAMKSAVGRLDRLHLLHGDFTDVAKYGPFDIIYTSNALSHFRQLPPPVPKPPWYQLPVMTVAKDFAPLVRAGGLMIDTNTEFKGPEFTLLRKSIGYRGSWIQYMYRRNAEAAKVEKAA